MHVRSITADGAIRSFRMRQTIETRYRDMPASSTSELLTEARRDPAAVLTTHQVNGGQRSTTLIVAGGLWRRTSADWVATKTDELPADWALSAYCEVGDMSLVAPLSAQQVVDRAAPAGVAQINGVATTIITATTETVLHLLMEDYRAAGRSKHDPATPDSYINHYSAHFWIDTATGFILRERTVVEYTEERLHGQVVGTGPATFTTTREFYDFNTQLDIPEPR